MEQQTVHTFDAKGFGKLLITHDVETDTFALHCNDQDWCDVRLTSTELVALGHILVKIGGGE